MCTARGQKNEPITIKPVTNIMKQMAIVISSFNLDALDQFGQIVSLLYTSSPNHSQVVDLMCFLAKGNRSGYDKQTSLKNVVECFVANLPKVGYRQCMHAGGFNIRRNDTIAAMGFSIFTCLVLTRL